MPEPDRDLKERVEHQASQIDRARKERATIMAQTIYAGTLGLVFVLPVVIGAYVGRWIDGFADGYSVRWTISLIVTGVVVGAVNVYLLVKD